MAIVNFIFDKEKDVKNIWNAANLTSKLANFSNNLKPELLYLTQGRNFLESKEDLENFNKKIYSSELALKLPSILSSSWSKIEKEYIRRVEKITGKPFNKKSITGYITTISKCPYNPISRWFMVSMYNSIPGCMLTTGHELFHIHMHDYFFNFIMSETNHEIAHDIKEAVTTALLNIEFKDLWLIEDKGYEKHKELLKFVSEEWKKEKDFRKLIIKCIDLFNKIKINGR